MIARLVAFVLALLLIATAPVAAQPEERSLPEGQWALLFSVQPRLSLGAFDGMTLGIKRQIRADRALRLAVDMEGTVGNSEGTRESRRVGRHENTASDAGQVRLGGALAAHHLAYMGAGDVTGYLGLGPRLAYSYDEEDGTEWIETRREDGTVDTITTITNGHSTSWGVGLDGAFGAEWIVHDSISLFAEYRINLMYESTHREHEVRQEQGGFEFPVNEDEGSSYGWNFPNGRVQLGLSLFF